MMDYLNRDHLIFQVSPAKRILAVQILLNIALLSSHSFRIQFDRNRLQQVIGIEELMKLMPGLPEPVALIESTSAYDIHEEPLNTDKIEILQRLLSFELEGWNDLPLNYIESITLLDETKQIVFRGNNMNVFQLFALPESERAALIEAYARERIPEEVIEEVEIDLSSLYP
jgi:hypothetical protein